MVEQGHVNGFPLAAEDAKTRYDNQTRNSGYAMKVSLVAPLGEKQLDYIESLRDKTAKGDVTLCLDITARCLTTQAQTTADKNVELRQMLVAKNGEFVTESFVSTKLNVTIPSSDWINDFVPSLGLGRFVVMEIPVPSLVTKDGTLHERLQQALEDIAGAKELLLHGEWTLVCDAIRGAWEVLRGYDALESLMKSQGFTDAAWTEFNRSLDAQFQLASKFAHRLDKGKKLMPEIPAEKEDAYHVYLMAASIVNQIAKKAKRAS